MSTSSIWSAARTTSSGTFSCCSMPVIWATTSLRLSRCWTLTVEITVMPGVEQFLDVLPALRVLAARGVGVGEFVDQHHLRADAPAPRRRRVRGTRLPRYSMYLRRHDLDAVEQVGGLLAAVGLHHRGDHVGAAFQPAVRLAEHREGLADAGSCAQVDAQLPALVGSASVTCPSSTGHRAVRRLLTGSSRARLSCSTLTRGSPMKPSARPSVCSATSCTDLFGADAAGRRDPVHLQVRVRRGDVRVQAAAAGGDGVGGHRRVGGGAAADRARSGRSL